MTLPATRDVGDLSSATTGQVRNYLGVPTPSDDVTKVFSPPIRELYITTGGNLAITLAGDDETDANAIATIPVVTGDKLTTHAIRTIRATGTTAVLGPAFR